MEIMHSKLVKLQTVLMLLALLFTVLLPSPVHAVDDAPAAQAVQTGAISDPNTTGIWYRTQGFNTSTVGRIWADKTVATDKIEFQNGPLAEKKESIDKPDDGSDFLIALSTMSSVLSSSTTTTNALDIVLVLDASGSMDDPMGNGDSAKRINALKQAINGFDSHGEHTDGVLDMIAAQNEKLASDKKIRVAIVKYAGKETDRPGNDTYKDDGFTYNYTQIMRDLTECSSGRNLSNLKSTVNSITPAGATRSDYAMNKASEVITNANRNSKKVVIFFTDGKPSSFSNFDSGVANRAVSTAKGLKDNGTKIYTVGIFSGADADTVPAYDQRLGWNLSAENLFMNAVSSNYPSANAYNSLGTRAEDAGYYKAASNSTELKDAFDAIINSTLQEPPLAPTEIKGDNPAKTGYVTFNDTLGDYMEVKNFNAIVFADQIFRASDDSPTIKRSNQGNKTTTTYTFTNEITGGNVAYPNRANLADVIITVTHYNNDYQHGDDVKVDIPITMLPLRNYQLTTVDDVTQMAISPTYPISVFYSVGLKDNVREVLSGNVTDDTTDLAASLSNYMSEKKMTSAVDFYANAYSGAHSITATDPDVTIGDATASFTPATSNNYYYYTKDTPIYMDKACTQPVKEFHFDTEYYYKVDYYEIDGKNADALAGKSVPATEGSNVVQIKVASGSDVLDTNKIFLNKSDNCYYIAAGTKKGSLPQAVDEQLGPKEKNLTETASRRIDFGWDSNYTTGMLYLGNNGKLTLDAVGDLKITKKVNASDASYTPDTDNLGFSIQVTLTGKGADGKYTYLVGGETKEFKSGDIITLQKDQTAEIKGLPAGCSYTVAEVSPPAGYTPSYTNGSGTIEACKTKDVTVTNTYTPAPYENKPGNADYLFQAVKQLDGRPWAESDAFTIVLMPAKGSPAPASTEHVVDKATDNGTPFDFGTITFDKPGTYTYTIYEKAPAQRLPGIDYDTSSYTVTVVVKDNGHGQLELDKENSKIELNPNSDGNVAEMPENRIPLFLNIFDAKDEVVNFKAAKNYVDNFGSEIL